MAKNTGIGYIKSGVPGVSDIHNPVQDSKRQPQPSPDEGARSVDVAAVRKEWEAGLPWIMGKTRNADAGAAVGGVYAAVPKLLKELQAARRELRTLLEHGRTVTVDLQEWREAMRDTFNMLHAQLEGNGDRMGAADLAIHISELEAIIALAPTEAQAQVEKEV